MSAESVNCFLVFFTLVLAVVGVFQVWLLWLAFHADHRPHVQVRHIKLLSDLSNLDFLKTRPFEFEIAIANKGAGHATICESNLAFVLHRSKNPLFENLQTITDSILSGKLKSGAEVSRKFSLDYQKAGLSMLVSFSEPQPLSLYLLGTLQYRDRIRRPYKTGFCRRFVMAARTAGSQDGRDIFVRVDDPDYEYAD
ncbi:hypothetical protein [Candidatus Binatus sp.]|jgi:hypothetical protein|uniref:hypothetical protein n=1 Tax=Candidatus Binatus sp. TaxID=2811406 RepID=UPI003BBE198B